MAATSAFEQVRLARFQCSMRLQAAGLIKLSTQPHDRRDRLVLEPVACECYGVIKTELDAVIRRSRRRFGRARSPALRE